jgi:hypothetical protein
MQTEIYHQNSQSLYPPEPFTLDHSTMRHPVAYQIFIKRNLIFQCILGKDTPAFSIKYEKESLIVEIWNYFTRKQ